MSNITTEATHLGKSSSYPQFYDKSVLVKVERSLNRIDYKIDNSNLPFVGFDTWNCFEASFLTEQGLPVAGYVKIVYPCESQCIVESKSLKLYLNSYNMSKFGETAAKGIDIVVDQIEADLSEFLDTRVSVNWFTSYDVHEWGAINYTYSTFEDINSIVDLDYIKFDVFDEDPELIEYFDPTGGTAKDQFKCDMLRSNCKVTSQPDWGTVFVRYEGKRELDLTSFVKYIVSFRNENHFHEEVVEMIYKRLYDKLKPKKLMVTAVYTRRGGIDICPSRATHHEMLDKSLIDSGCYVEKEYRQ
jgi:7-cyano-7-deazaguanine reductase